MAAFGLPTSPDFLIIGAQKAGTTWLRAMLRQHPRVYAPGREIHFFNKADNYRLGLDWYRGRFRWAGRDQIAGEKTPNYLWTNPPPESTDLPASQRRIADALPDARLIVVLRDPVDRAVSAYNHHLARGRIHPDASMGRILFGDRRSLRRRHGVLTMGLYGRQLEHYLKAFDADQLLVLIFEEDVVEAPWTGLRKACSFLGLDASRISSDANECRHAHSTGKLRAYLNYWLPIPNVLTRPIDAVSPSWERTPPPGVRERLRHFYAADRERLFGLLGRRIGAWAGVEV
jgi:hypothetical protein